VSGVAPGLRRSIGTWWAAFAARHTLIAQFVVFYAFSLVVTVLQYLLLTFLPGLFFRYTDWAEIPAQLVPLRLGPVDTYVFDYPVTGDETGGMGYFAAFAITLFIAQCVNFPMQRNITFRSRGNVWYQMAWYALAFVLITIVCSFLMGLYVPFLKQHLAPAVYNIAITVVNGGVQMVIYFPIYKIIFPSAPAAARA
jgi:putative flippase GtrA